MDQVYLDSVKSTNSNKKWTDVDISSRSLHTLECKEVLQNLEYPVDTTFLLIISRE